jgi:tetratricopeptide (TPR) repeat protein
VVLKWLGGLRKPNDTVATQLERARALRMQDDFDAARAAAQEILRDDPQHAGALALMAAIAADQRQVEEGLTWAARALQADTECVPAHFARGRLLEAAERFGEAEAAFRRVTELDPRNAHAFTNLGCMLHLQQRFEDAVRCYRAALQVEPGQPTALRNYALLAGGAEEVGEALQGFERHVGLHPQDAEAQLQLGHLYQQVDRHEESLSAYERAVALEPDRPDFHFARAQALLFLGRYEEGWQEYDWRWRMPSLNEAMLRFSEPRWDGRKLEQGTVLLHGESAFGDAIQFVRYATLAAERCAKVIVQCPPALQALIAGVPGVAQAVPEGEPLPPFDAHLPLIACPLLFGTTLATVPWRGPYFHADAARAAHWRERVAQAAPRRRKVGVLWTGNANNPNNRQRSFEARQLALLAPAGHDVSFFSLQKGAPPPQAGDLPPEMHFVDLTAELRDFSDTAALLAQLDLVIAVDTSVAHLAGALGRPTWLLLPHSAEWRWLADGADCPWYPTMRLFRLETERDWEGGLRKVAQALGDWASA